MPAPEAETLHGAIDRGLTGDKVAFPDPAASPLGTDDEAAGAPDRGARTAIAEREERDTGGASPNPQTTRATQPSPARASAETNEASQPASGLDPGARRLDRTILIVAAVVLVVAALVVMVVWR